MILCVLNEFQRQTRDCVQLINMADNKVYRASTTAPVNIAVVK